jgi:hypothetical protein
MHPAAAKAQCRELKHEIKRWRASKRANVHKRIEIYTLVNHNFLVQLKYKSMVRRNQIAVMRYANLIMELLQ